MDDTGCRGFFLEPVATYHRQYEALRAFFIEGRRLHDIAQQFGYQFAPRYRDIYADFRGAKFYNNLGGDGAVLAQKIG